MNLLIYGLSQEVQKNGEDKKDSMKVQGILTFPTATDTCLMKVPNMHANVLENKYEMICE